MSERSKHHLTTTGVLDVPETERLIGYRLLLGRTRNERACMTSPNPPDVLTVQRPRLLDLFCGAGGCTKGYQRAGFYVVGVDVKPQPRYCGDEFYQADALEFPLDGFDAIHASPPCQAFTDLKGMWNRKQHVDLLTPTRELLKATGLPYVIENVEGAPMNGSHITLCGSAFLLGAEDAELRRHRHFETNFPLIVPPCRHGWQPRVIGVYGGHGRDRRRTVNTQDYSTASRREAMGIDWMTGEELSQAIPPAYTEYVGGFLMREVLERRKVAA